MDEKVFAIFNTKDIGDILVSNVLVQNIKLYFPESRIIFVCKEETADAARYQTGVNDVVIFDEKKLKSIKGVFEFINNFSYKKPFASFVTSSDKICLIISRFIGSTHIISHRKFGLWNTDEKYEMRGYTHMKDIYGGMTEALTNEHKNLPIKYIPPKIDNALIQGIRNLNKPVIISAADNLRENSMDLSVCKDLIQALNNEGCNPVLTGRGEGARQCILDLKRNGCFDFIDIVDCASFVELANILQICGRCISVNTGVLHLSNALNVPVVGIFKSGTSEIWGSDTNMYPAKNLDTKESGQINPQNIIQSLKELTGLAHKNITAGIYPIPL